MQRGRMRGVATRGNTIAFGEFALQAQECGSRFRFRFRFRFR